PDERDANHRTIAITGVDQNDAFATTPLRPELLERGALAIATRAKSQNSFPCRIGASETDHHIVIIKLDGLHTCRGATHCADVQFVEPNRFNVACSDQKLARTISHCGGQ